MSIIVGTPVLVFSSGKWVPGYIVDLEDPANPGDGLAMVQLNWNLSTGSAAWSVSRGYHRSDLGSSWKFLQFTSTTSVTVTAEALTETTSESPT